MCLRAREITWFYSQRISVLQYSVISCSHHVVYQILRLFYWLFTNVFSESLSKKQVEHSDCRTWGETNKKGLFTKGQAKLRASQRGRCDTLRLLTVGSHFHPWAQGRKRGCRFLEPRGSKGTKGGRKKRSKGSLMRRATSQELWSSVEGCSQLTVIAGGRGVSGNKYSTSTSFSPFLIAC